MLQAIWQATSETLKRSIRFAPLSPLIRRCHVGSTPQPSGVTIPIPVITTRLIAGLRRKSRASTLRATEHRFHADGLRIETAAASAVAQLFAFFSRNL